MFVIEVFVVKAPVVGDLPTEAPPHDVKSSPVRITTIEKDLKHFILPSSFDGSYTAKGNFATSTAVSPARNLVPSER